METLMRRTYFIPDPDIKVEIGDKIEFEVVAKSEFGSLILKPILKPAYVFFAKDTIEVKRGGSVVVDFEIRKPTFQSSPKIHDVQYDHNALQIQNLCETGFQIAAMQPGTYKVEIVVRDGEIYTSSFLTVDVPFKVPETKGFLVNNLPWTVSVAGREHSFWMLSECVYEEGDKLAFGFDRDYSDLEETLEKLGAHLTDKGDLRVNPKDVTAGEKFQLPIIIKGKGGSITITILIVIEPTAHGVLQPITTVQIRKGEKVKKTVRIKLPYISFWPLFENVCVVPIEYGGIAIHNINTSSPEEIHFEIEALEVGKYEVVVVAEHFGNEPQLGMFTVVVTE